MNVLYFLLIGLFSNQMEYTIASQNARGGYSIRDAFEKHFSYHGIQQCKKSIDVSGYYVLCNDNQPLLLYNISCMEYSKAKDDWRVSKRERRVGSYYFLFDNSGNISNHPLTRFNLQLPANLTCDAPLSKHQLYIEYDSRIKKSRKKFPREIHLLVNPEKENDIQYFILPKRFTLLSESPLQFRFTDRNFSKDFTIKPNDQKYWVENGKIDTLFNLLNYYYSKKSHILYIQENNEISSSNLDNVYYQFNFFETFQKSRLVPYGKYQNDKKAPSGNWLNFPKMKRMGSFIFVILSIMHSIMMKHI